jgi:thymidylate synthase
MNYTAGDTVPDLYHEAWWLMRINSVEEDSRNGKVMTLECPTNLCLREPEKRVLFDPLRDANPFFHVMEAVWMFSGGSDVEWVSQFNQGYRQYAEDNGEVWGAYGARWMNHFGPGWLGDNPMNQILEVIDILKADPTSRQAVIGMWDPAADLSAKVRDMPCNTHIYLRIVRGRLNMTVCNRSNDMVWGALGANVVHMTLLQELIARGVGIPVGEYNVLSNNLHVYKDREDVKKLWNTCTPVDPYLAGLKTYPILQREESVEDLLWDCENLVNGTLPATSRTAWVNDVVLPMHDTYLEKKVHREIHLEKIKAEDWRLACEQWVARRKSAVSPNPSPTPSPGS